MKPEELQLIKDVLAQAGAAGSATMEAYVRWHFAAAITWFLCGIVLLVAAAVLTRTTLRIMRETHDDTFLGWVGVVLCALLGLLMFATNLPDIIAPDAAAIHQLLRDVRSE